MNEEASTPKPSDSESDNASPSPSDAAPTTPSNGNSSSPAWKPISVLSLAGKELRETLRDRRTIATLFLMPIIVYPILSMLVQGFIASSGVTQPSQSIGGDGPLLTENQYLFMFEDAEQYNQVARILNQGYIILQQERGMIPKDQQSTEAGIRQDAIDYNLLKRHEFQALDPLDDQNLESLVRAGGVDVGIRMKQKPDPRGQQPTTEVRLVYRDDIPRSIEAVRFFEALLDAINMGTYRGLLRSEGRYITAPIELSTSAVELPPAKSGSGISFAALIPLVLTLMTITGAVYPAIDLTAGERERGTLESIIAAPIPRMRILLGKLVAIVAVAMLTAMVNLVGMMVTLWVFQFDRVLFGEQGLTLVPVLQILGLLMLFAIFFSSVLLVITSFARSFKEGQAYLIPVMMVALAPSLMSLKPDLKLEGLWTVTPLVNIVLLARDVLSGNAQWPSAVVTICTTVLYSMMAITMAARFFGTAKVLYGNDQGIGTLFHRPTERRKYASASLAMLCLALLFPASFIWQGVMTRAATGNLFSSSASTEVTASVDVQLMLAALGLFVVFLLTPLILAWFHRLNLANAFGATRPSLFAIAAGILMGLGFGPLLLQLILLTANLMEQIGLSQSEIWESLSQRSEGQVAKLQQASFPLLLFAMAVMPAICEELFFRGLLFRALRQTLSPWVTIIATALLFGAFHLISTSGLELSRLLPTTLMGIVLGWVAYRSGSVIPGILLHCLHNAVTVLVAKNSKEMVARGWIDESQTSLPMELLAGAAVLAVGGVLLLLASKPSIMKTSESNEDDVGEL